MATTGALTDDVTASAAPPILERQCRGIPNGAAVPGKYRPRAALPLSAYPPRLLPAAAARRAGHATHVGAALPPARTRRPRHEHRRTTAAAHPLRPPRPHATTTTTPRTIPRLYI